MKQICAGILIGIVMLMTLSACSNIDSSFSQVVSEQNSTQGDNTMQEYTNSLERQQNANAFTIKISVNGTELTAVLENNVTTRALVEQMPMTLSMRDLYDREICYNYGTGAFPTETLRNDSYEVGDIIYWPTAGSFVILYRQWRTIQQATSGHIELGWRYLETTGNTDVTFGIDEFKEGGYPWPK
ncbi:MAG: cyclophilin-like fold protein [Acutalibacteraceae bacterium]